MLNLSITILRDPFLLTPVKFFTDSFPDNWNTADKGQVKNPTMLHCRLNPGCGGLTVNMMISRSIGRGVFHNVQFKKIHSHPMEGHWKIL